MGENVIELPPVLELTEKLSPMPHERAINE
jgi:hypothetical protein